jgi:hypothetical protein
MSKRMWRGLMGCILMLRILIESKERMKELLRMEIAEGQGARECHSQAVLWKR